MESKKTTTPSAGPLEFGFVKDGIIYRKKIGNYPEKPIGEVRETEQKSLNYFVDKFTLLTDKVDRLEEEIEAATNKGSYLVRLQHLRSTLATYDGLGDFTKLDERLEKMEEYLNSLIDNNRKRNTEIKTALIAELVPLTDSIEWKEASEKIKSIKDRWVKTGLPENDKKDELDTLFSALVEKFYQRRNEFFEERKKLFEERVAKYQSLVNEILELKEKGVYGKVLANEVKRLKLEWRAVGKIPKVQLEPLIQVFLETNKQFKQLLKGLKKTQRHQRAPFGAPYQQRGGYPPQGGVGYQRPPYDPNRAWGGGSYDQNRPQQRPPFDPNRPPRPYEQGGQQPYDPSRQFGPPRPRPPFEERPYQQGFAPRQPFDPNRPQRPPYEQGGAGYDRPQRPPFEQGGGGYDRPQRPPFEQGGGGYDRPQRPPFERQPYGNPGMDGGYQQRRPYPDPSQGGGYQQRFPNDGGMRFPNPAFIPRPEADPEQLQELVLKSVKLRDLPFEQAAPHAKALQDEWKSLGIPPRTFDKNATSLFWFETERALEIANLEGYVRYKNPGFDGMPGDMQHEIKLGALRDAITKATGEIELFEANFEKIGFAERQLPQNKALFSKLNYQKRKLENKKIILKELEGI